MSDADHTTKRRIRRNNPAERHPIAVEIERRMASLGLTNKKRLSVAAGLGETYVGDLLAGRWTNPKPAELTKIAAVLGCSLRELEAPIQMARPVRTTEELRAARFRAARWACWESREKAARYLGMMVDDLTRLEEARKPITDSLLIRFALLTGVPVPWVQYGDLGSVPPAIAARIGYYDPTLLPDTPSGPSTSGADEVG